MSDGEKVKDLIKNFKRVYKRKLNLFFVHLLLHHTAEIFYLIPACQIFGGISADRQELYRCVSYASKPVQEH